MTFRTICAAIGLALLATTAGACPNYERGSISGTFSAGDFYQPQTASVRAGGDQSINGCGIRFGSDRGRGYVTVAPDFTIRINGLENYKIEFSVVSECDSILLINTGTGSWFYDDDDNGNYDARIILTRPRSGRFDIWVGTHDGAVCDAQLKIETYRR